MFFTELNSLALAHKILIDNLLCSFQLVYFNGLEMGLFIFIFIFIFKY